MGAYNPDAPFIIGNEWPGIRNEEIQLGINQNTAEYGYKFTIGPSDNLATAHAIVYTDPTMLNMNPLSADQVIGVSVYPAGAEANSGPIKRVMIPCTSGAVSGIDFAVKLNSTITSPPVSATTIASSVFDPSSGASITFKQPTTANLADTPKFVFYFGTTSYQQQLFKKRILAINIIVNVTAPIGTDEFSLGVAQCPLSASLAVGTTMNAVPLGNVFADNTFQRISMGEQTPFYGVPAATGAYTLDIALPWTFKNIISWDPSAASKIGLCLTRLHGATVQPAGGFDYVLNWVAMEVIYCEETRLAVGGKHIIQSQVQPNFGYGDLSIALFDINSTVTSFTFPSAGNYSIFMSAPSFFQTPNLSFGATFPPYNAMRPYYDLPNLSGLQIIKPWPVENAIGDTFQLVTTPIMPQIDIGNAGTGGPQPYSHVYGRRAEAPVYTGVSPNQILNTASVVPGTVFNQVRAYARHFNNAVTDLGFAIGGSMASITVVQFDALPDILDGWSEVTLPLDVPFTVTGGSSAQLVAFDTGVGTLITDDFDNGVGAWFVSGGTFVIDNTHVRSGSNAAKLTVVGTPTQTFSRRTFIPAVAGSTYTAAIWLFATSNLSNVQATIDFSDNVGGFIASAVTTVSLVANVWQRVVVSGVAPAGTFRASAGPTLQSSPPAGTAIWVDTFAQGIGPANTSANRWEILGVTSRSFHNITDVSNSGVVPSYLNAAQFPTDIATYLPLTGDVVDMTWISPTASAQAADTAADAVAMLSQNPPTPTGLTAATATQAFSVNIDCLVPPQAIPTGMSYIQVSWTAASVTGSGFAYYELQRQDTFDTTWNTIAKITTEATTSFKDYEARVGIASTYRLRIGNALAFVGNFATSSPVTISAPGVSGFNVSNSILVFTTNADQTGASNLGYTASWDGTPSEDYTFLEASRSQLQVMYGKNFLSAFQPTERGGEQFSRTLEVNNAAGAAGPVSEAAFNALRNTAWAVVPYICVRNELGDRWFANINVPSGSLQRNRRLQLANIVVTEISQLPYAVPL